MAFCTSCNVQIPKEKHECENCGEPLCETCYAENEGICKECKEDVVDVGDDELLDQMESVFDDTIEDL
jgi:hypothetical protein